MTDLEKQERATRLEGLYKYIRMLSNGADKLSVDEMETRLVKVFGGPPPNVRNAPAKDGSCGVLDGRYDPVVSEVLRTLAEAGLQARTGLQDERSDVVRIPNHGETLVIERPDFRFDYEAYNEIPKDRFMDPQRLWKRFGIKVRRYLKNAKAPQMGIPDDLLPEEWALLLFARGSRGPEGWRDRLCIRIGQRLQALNGSWFYRATTPEYLTMALLRRLIQAHWHRKQLLNSLERSPIWLYQWWISSCRPFMDSARKNEGKPSPLTSFAQIHNPIVNYDSISIGLPIYPGYRKCSCCGGKIGREAPALFLRGFTEGLNYHEMITCSEACFEKAVRHAQASGLLKTIQDEQDLEEKRRRTRQGRAEEPLHAAEGAVAMVDIEGKILAATKGISERLVSSNRLVLAKQHLVLPDVALQTLYDFGIDPREVLETSPEFENFPIQVRRGEDGRTIDYHVAGYRLGVVGLKSRNIADPGIYSLRRHMLYLTSQGFVFDPLDEGEKPPIYEATMVSGLVEKLVEEGDLVFLAPEREGAVRNILEHWAAPCSPMCFYEPGVSEDFGIYCTKREHGTPVAVPEVSCEPFFHLQARAFLAAALSTLEKKAGMDAVDQFLYRLYVLLVHAPVQGILYPENDSVAKHQADRTPAYAQTLRLLFDGDYERLVSLVEQSRGLELREGRALFPVPDAQLLSTREFFMMHPFFTSLGKIIADHGYKDKTNSRDYPEVLERLRSIADLIAQAAGVPVESLGLGLDETREADRMKLQALLIEHAPAIRASAAFARFDEKRQAHYRDLVKKECIPIRELLSRREDVLTLLGRPDPELEKAREKADRMEETKRLREVARRATERLLPIEAAQTRE